MNFDVIVLSHSEKRLLRVLSKSGPILEEPSVRPDVRRLESLGLAKTYIAAGVSPPAGESIARGVQITNDGISYLRYRSRQTRQRWSDRLWGFLSGVAVTVLGGVILQALIG